MPDKPNEQLVVTLESWMSEYLEGYALLMGLPTKQDAILSIIRDSEPPGFAKKKSAKKKVANSK